MRSELVTIFNLKQGTQGYLVVGLAIYPSTSLAHETGRSPNNSLNFLPPCRLTLLLYHRTATTASNGSQILDLERSVDGDLGV
jgi:hypothetical protein